MSPVVALLAVAVACRRRQRRRAAARAAEPAGAAHAQQAADEPASRVLVLSMPRCRTATSTSTELPEPAGAARRAVRSPICRVRGVHRRPTLGDGYVTIGAGTRSVGRPLDDGQCLLGAEPFEDGTAAEAMARRTGVDAGSRSRDGGRVPRAAGDRRPATTTCSSTRRSALLAEALDGAGVERAVIGNADQAEPSGAADYIRPVGLALADAEGIVPRRRGRPGSADASIRRRRSASAPRRNAYLAAFDRSWTRAECRRRRSERSRPLRRVPAVRRRQRTRRAPARDCSRDWTRSSAGCSSGSIRRTTP